MENQNEKIVMIFHEKQNNFPHITITPKERCGYLGSYGTSYDGQTTEAFVIVEAVRCFGVLYLQTAPIGRGIPALN